MQAVFQNHPFRLFRNHGQHLGKVFPDKGQPLRIFLTDDDLSGITEQHAEQGTESRGACAENQHRIPGGNLSDTGSPEAGGQNIPHKQRLPVRYRVRNPVQPLIRQRNPDKFRLSAVNPAAQRPSSFRMLAVVHIPFLTKEALTAEGLHIDRHPISGLDGLYFFAHFFHHAHHFMTYGNARNCTGHSAMENMQVAGADTGQRHPDNGVGVVPKGRTGLFPKGKFSFFHICIGQHHPFLLFMIHD